MKERSFDEMIAYFNRRVSEMDIAQDYKMELLGMVTALGYKHEKSVPQWIPCSKTEDLPKHEVLCCDKYGEELIGWLLYSDDQWLCESDCEMMYDPIAWREKPEPWKGEETCTKNAK